MTNVLSITSVCFWAAVIHIVINGENIRFTAMNMPEFKDHIVTEFVLTTHPGNLSLTECVIQCVVNPQCQTVFYNQQTQWCQTNKVGIMSPDLLIQSKATELHELRHPRCPVHLGYYFLRDGSMCYKIHPQKLEWEDARKSCQLEGGDLAVLNTPARFNHIVIAMNSSSALVPIFGMLIGLSDLEEEGVWRWVDGSILPESSEFWADGQPDNKKGIQHVALIRNSDKKIDDTSRGDFYVCEIQLT